MKAIFLEIKFDPKWILANQISGRSGVTEAVISAIKNKAKGGAVFTVKKEFHLCRLVVAFDRLFTKEETIALVKEAVSEIEESALSVSLEELEADRIGEMLGPISEKLSEGERELLEKEFAIKLGKAEEKENAPSDASSIIDADALIGMDVLKAWVNEINSISERFGGVARETAVFKDLSYLISINRGNGLTTVLSIMADTLKKSGRDFSNGRFVRNLAERIMSKAALRFEMSGADFEEFQLTEGDLSVAVADADFSKLFVKVKSTPRIGFN